MSSLQIGIIGGSLGGLATANALITLGHKVDVYEKSPMELCEKGSSLGFVQVPNWEFLRGGRPMMRIGERAHRGQGAYFYGDLWQYLYEGLPIDTIKFGKTITDLGFDPMLPVIEGKAYDLVVIADGGWSSLRPFVTGNRKQPEYAGQVIYRFKLPMKAFKQFTAEGTYENGRNFIIMYKMTRKNGEQYIMGGVAIPVPENEVIRPQEGANRQDLVPTQPLPDWFMPYVRQKFAKAGNGQVLKVLELACSKGKITPQPLFEYKADKVVNGRLVLLGDAAHMASPRTAVGAHTAILDAIGLLLAFQRNGSIDKALNAYGEQGLVRAEELYLRSKEVSRPLVYRAKEDDRYDEL